MSKTDIHNFIQEFAGRWPKDAPYYVWGTSASALKLCSLFDGRLNITAFVDNDEKAWGTLFQGRPVLSPEEFFLKRGDGRCIVASLAYGEISWQLERRGLAEHLDFCGSWYFTGMHRCLDAQELYLFRVDLSITSRCTLRCRHCNMLMPYYRQCGHYPAEDLLSDVDAYFRWVDHVDQFNILGGEPFLHPDVQKITKTITERYRSRINDLVFFSNGTVLPEEGLLDLMVRYQIKVDLGDYRAGVPAIRPKVDRFIEELERRGIAYAAPASSAWLDFNHPPEDRSSWKAEQLTAVRRNCREPFRGIHGQKYYFCHLNASAALGGLYPEEPGDSFDLSGSEEGRKEELLAYDLACLPKGYVSYCRHCGGCGPANQRMVPVAEQLPAGQQGRP
ncbi:radical SAM protein [Oscillibacter sp. 1-3]|uniref:radical SAM protein n=1 Tax=Oscillibacter sp. 1-3 TaxID=1235797 RepID=UPI00033DFDD8|nr:radical SAM protein [Oscillibacter sp. 1-3]EOS64176.1 hypothetical protein C816_03043 [Oscillibacter sp. 1-3]